MGVEESQDDDAMASGRTSLAERIQSNKDRSARRRETLRLDRAQKKRQSQPRAEKSPEHQEDVCIICVHVHACLQSCMMNKETDNTSM